MLGDLIISIVVWFAQGLINALPSSTGFDQGVYTAFASLGGYTDIFSPIVPWATLAIVVGIVFTTELGIFAFKTLKWIISHLPFIGGHG